MSSGSARRTIGLQCARRSAPSPTTLPGRGRGHLLIGAGNDGNASGTADDELILVLANVRDGARILPRPVITVAKGSFAGAECVHVTVEAARVRPVRLDGVCWVRVGTSTRRATREEEILLAERTVAADLPFDQRAVAGSGIADLSVEPFRSIYLPAVVDTRCWRRTHSLEQQRASLGVLDPVSGAARILGPLVIRERDRSRTGEEDDEENAADRGRLPALR